MNDHVAVPRGKMVNAFDPSKADALDADTRRAIERRNALLGPAYRLFYDNPVQVVRGQGVRLFDAQGNEYLDAYNNVVSVGHAHPRVVKAIADQLSTLCTHTRYIQEGILAYADDLLATFEDEIGHAMFTCTGSEANDLAMRIARFKTGHRGVIITAEAYHGNSHLTAGFSPSMGPNSPIDAFVRRIPAPDSYRLDPATLSRHLVEHVDRQIEDLERRGEGVAAFIADGLFSSDGVYSEPTDILGPIAERVRRAGGLYIADEVQCGFARSGTHMWGYQRHGVVPDIVTMGKPMGNGYPVAGIALRPEVVAGFGHAMRYFNTFGGNTVAMAAAQATLDVIRDEGLMDNAVRVGAIIADGLRDIMRSDERVGDVRGAGLYYGVEMVRDRATKEPDAARASAVVNGLRERRVLISATGAAANNLKIRPPLVFTPGDADQLLSEIRTVLSTV